MKEKLFRKYLYLSAKQRAICRRLIGARGETYKAVARRLKIPATQLSEFLRKGNALAPEKQDALVRYLGGRVIRTEPEIEWGEQARALISAMGVGD